MNKLMLIIAICVLALTASSTARAYIPGTSCTAIYQVPSGQPYNTKSLRPPMWTTNRWDCLAGGTDWIEFEDSPGDGVTTLYGLNLRYDTSNGVVFYPIVYVDAELLSMKVAGQIAPGWAWAVDQNPGRVTFTQAPGFGGELFFQITAP